MFLKYLEPIFRPWRAVRSKIVKVKTVRGNIGAESRRVQRFGNIAKRQQKRVSDAAKSGSGGPPGNSSAVDLQSGADPGSHGYDTRVQAQPGQNSVDMMKPKKPRTAMDPHGYPRHLPPIRIKGFFWKRKSCTQCNVRLEMSWDRCPYCWQAFAPRAKAKPSQTQAMKLAQAKEGVKYLGWVVSIIGVQRGELFTLTDQNVIGKDASCTVVLHDEYLSSRHIEIVQRDGMWLLRDLGSSNGTMVNDKSVTQHELVDSDFIGIGNSVIKFKCLEHGGRMGSFGKMGR
jgi:hypothetical protein